VTFPDHPFRSEKKRNAFLALYDEKSRNWPGEADARAVKTSWGETFVRSCGPDDGTPIVLLPGIGNTSLAWMRMVPLLSGRYRVHAIDNIYDYGRSVNTRPITSGDDFAAWLDELFDSLGLGAGIHLVGASYGGWIFACYTLAHSERVGKLVMLAPAATVAKLHLAFLLTALPCLLPHPWFTRKSLYYLQRDAVNRGGECRQMIEDTAELTYLAIRSYKMRPMVEPQVLDDDRLRAIAVPTLFAVGENEKLYPPAEALDRLSVVAPEIRSELIPSAGHDLWISQAEKVSEMILGFIEG
jgi:pimeloyl-ACP methyl ester carboxylesterase